MSTLLLRSAESVCIGGFLKELDLTEGRATGIPKIIRAMRENGSPEPQFETEEERTTFLVRLPVHSLAQSRTDQATDQAQALRASLLGELAAALGASTDQVTDQVADQVGRMLQLAAVAPAKSEELIDAAGLAHRPHFRAQYLVPIMQAGWLVRTHPQPSHPQQRYKLTTKGKAWLDSFNAMPKP
jgi:ATP-dependent DNA helicase RecG